MVFTIFSLPKAQSFGKRAKNFQNIMAITEARNNTSRHIGELDGHGIIKIFEMNDTSLFSEINHGQPGLCHQKVLHKIRILKETILELLHENEGNTQIILAGCGTSGRLGFILSKMFDKFMRLSQSRTSFQNCMAGGSAALISSQEGSEDNPDVGKEDLISVLHEEKAVYIGTHFCFPQKKLDVVQSLLA